MASNKMLTTGLVGYLTPEAKCVHDNLIGMGLDPDLALTILEISVPEYQIFHIPDENRHDRTQRDIDAT